MKRENYFFILDHNGEPKQVADADTWAQWFGTVERHVALDEVGPFEVSTVFLGLNHNFRGEGPPILWETMVFNGGKPTDDMDRYASKEAALAGHKAIVDEIRRKLN